MFSIIIPAYNEENSIGDTINRLLVAAKKSKTKIEILVVDDCSTDKTAVIAEKYGTTILRNIQNQGYGKSIKIGINECKYEIIGITDADGTYPVEDLFKMLENIAQGFDLVVGVRSNVHSLDSKFKTYLRALLRKTTEAAAGTKILDPNSGLRIFKKSDICAILSVLCDRFSFTTSMSVAYGILGKNVKYMPIVYSERVGKSKVRLIRDSFVTLNYIMRTVNYFNPLKIFIFLALIVLLAGMSSVVVGLALTITTAIQFGIAAMITSIFILGLGLLSEQVRLLRIETNARK